MQVIDSQGTARWTICFEREFNHFCIYYQPKMFSNVLFFFVFQTFSLDAEKFNYSIVRVRLYLPFPIM